MMHCDKVKARKKRNVTGGTVFCSGKDLLRKL